jgi:hypothetical protein
MSKGLMVRSEITGKEYACSQNASGLWQCGRCETGVIPSWEDGPPRVSASCPTCGAKVIDPGASSMPRLVWVIVFIVLAALAVAALPRLR